MPKCYYQNESKTHIQNAILKEFLPCRIRKERTNLKVSKKDYDFLQKYDLVNILEGVTIEINTEN